MKRMSIFSLVFILIAASSISIAHGMTCDEGTTLAWDDINNVHYCRRDKPVKPSILYSNGQ